jgi:glucose/arabinose dehydrogenase
MIMKRILQLFVVYVLTGCNSPAEAQMTTRVVRDSLFIPWELVYGPDDHIWFTQKNGYICRLEPVSGKIDTLYHETAATIQFEGGMLGLALHPSFPAQPYVYVAFNYNSGSYKEKVVRYTYASNALQSPQTLIDNIAASAVHNGCRLLIADDKLFITTGDASASSNGQNINSPNAKVLRINLDGSIPADNPIPGNPAWSWGHRNAQGLVYANNRLYSSEHGPNSDDEVNIIRKGRNFGWPYVSGYCNTPSEIAFCNDSNVVEPLKVWTPTLAVCGIDYYNHPMFPSLQQSLLMMTLKDEKMYQLKLTAGLDSIASTSAIPSISFGRLRDICISPEGRIYISTSESSASGGTPIDKIIEIFDPSFTSVANISRSSDLTIYPNPAGDYTVVKMPSGLFREQMKFEVLDQSGKVVLKGNLTGANTRLRTGGIPPGVYHVKITGENGKVYSGKITKQ